MAPSKGGDVITRLLDAQSDSSIKKIVVIIYVIHPPVELFYIQNKVQFNKQ